MLSATFITMAEEPLSLWLSSSILGRAERNGLLKTRVDSILAEVKSHHEIDDTPYGGGPGELMRVDVIAPIIKKALSANLGRERTKKRVLLMDPAGTTFNHEHARRLSTYEELIFVCGRYEGIDARIHHYVDEAISLGDFVLSSGDMAALAIFDACARLTAGVLGNKNSIVHESHAEGRLECSHYTRPLSFEDYEIPPVLQSGHHALIEKERQREGLLRTKMLRPDLLVKFPPNDEEKALLAKAKSELRAELYPWQKKP